MNVWCPQMFHFVYVWHRHFIRNTYGMGSSRCWEHSFGNLDRLDVIDVITFVSCTLLVNFLLCHIPVLAHLDSDLATGMVTLFCLCSGTSIQ